jgi:hypothetical protein
VSCSHNLKRFFIDPDSTAWGFGVRRFPTRPSQGKAVQPRRWEDAARYLAALTRFFQANVSDHVNIEVITNVWFRVTTPHAFHDGEPFVLELRRGTWGWQLCDGLAMRQRFTAHGAEVSIESHPEVAAAMQQYQVQSGRCGFCMSLDSRPLAGQLSCFLQFLSRVANAQPASLMLSHSDYVRRFRDLLARNLPEDRLQFDWTDREQDRRRLHRVDCRIDCDPPWLAFAVQSSSGCRRVRRVCEFWQSRGLNFRSVVFFQNLRRIVAGDIARVSDVVDKQFSSLDSETCIERFLQTRLACCACQIHKL